jgi:Protein of unknown function (DUF4013)
MDTGVILSESVAYTREAFEGKWIRWLTFVILSLPMALLPFVLDMTKIMDKTTTAIHWELIPWDQVAAVIVTGLLFSFFLSGYMVRIYRGIKPAPDFDDWGGLFLDGLKLNIVSFIWFLPVLIVVLCALGLVVAGIASPGSGLTGLYIGLLLLALLVGMVLLIIVALFSIMGVIRFARTGSITEGLRYAKIAEHIGKIGWGNYIVALVVLGVAGFIFSIVLMILSMIPYAGWVFTLVFTPLLTVFSARYYTIIYDQAAPQPEPA